MKDRFYGMPNSKIREMIQEQIHGRNAARNRRILERKLLDDLTYEQIAEEFSMSDRQIKTIVYNGMNCLFLSEKDDEQDKECERFFSEICFT